MENGGRTNNQNDDEVQAFYAMFVLLICVECSKEPEFRCENCDKVYKQEGRYHVHLAKCRGKEPDDGRCGDGGGGGNVGGGGGGGGACVSASEFTELLRQNREMMALLQKQQETIQTLVSQLAVVSK